ncbi:MAG: hypothetical protein ACRDI2_04140 [Chloroflexota bacterium]
MTKADLHRLVDELPDEAVDSISTLVQHVLSRQIDPAQLWFWTPEWQQKEREVDESLARGERGIVHQSSEQFLAALDARIQRLEP